MKAPPFHVWAARLDSLCWRVIGCCVWDLARADEGDARAVFEDGGKPSDYLRSILK